MILKILFICFSQGMKFENVSILTENVLDIIQDMKYCWLVNTFENYQQALKYVF